MKDYEEVFDNMMRGISLAFHFADSLIILSKAMSMCPTNLSYRTMSRERLLILSDV
jgi:hypothetical protein